ncbi:MAG: YmfQ family protein [Oscillospiraceae bacterium]|jgi:hypothetical protein|nr:DUF2313 domain-containing protein [Oscillospiraceae bacterium]MDE6998608.1 YmfQ family protein [Oscillospiraceae bacterium]
MGYSEHLVNLLRPLGIYDLKTGSLSRSELDALGHELDALSSHLDHVEQESALATAEDEGLDRWESLFARTPVRYTTELRRQAIAALLRISGDSFTLTDINNTISGCGIKAVVQETGQFGYVRIIFPDVAGVPDGFEQIQEIILDIIPCHLDVEFFFRYLTWEECEAHQYTWSIIHARAYTWHGFELAV